MSPLWGRARDGRARRGWPSTAACALCGLPRSGFDPGRAGVLRGGVLQYLRIRNLALLEAVELEFGPGFTAVTGETGAGKSILLGALQLLAGARADKTVIRQGAAVCEVEAALHFPNSAVLDAVLDRLELPRCEEGVFLLKRSVPREKAPRISVNGALATLAALQELGERWIDFHGPGEPRHLLKAGCQLELLDLFAGNREPLARYSGLYFAWRELQAKVVKLAAEKQLSPEQIEYMRGEVESLDGLELSEENMEALERDFQRVNRAQELINAARAVAEGLSGDEGLLGRLAPLVREGRGLEQLDPASKPLVDRLAALAVEAEDIGREFETLGGDFSFEPEQVEALTTRMEAWLEAKRKYGGQNARRVGRGHSRFDARLLRVRRIQALKTEIDIRYRLCLRQSLHSARVRRDHVRAVGDSRLSVQSTATTRSVVCATTRTTRWLALDE